MTDLPLLGLDALDAIAGLCRRAIDVPPSAAELEGSLFTSAQPAVVRGDPSIGVVATVAGDEGAHIPLLVVDPAARGKGHGHALVDAAESDARAAGHRSLRTGADAPFFLWPGVPST